ncbi:RING finger protein 32 [Aplysia californica]|uniref:RING finger protein 32 n=1 Tax=Aplysia californica TaxID=6500 RepID=A0ABM0JHW7_APLCA|nr:RING finger protein 32 [Aplysia californica]
MSHNNTCRTKDTNPVLNNKGTDGSSLTLTAVALQDHWSRALSLGPNFGPRKVGLGPAARARHKPQAKSVIDTGLNRGKRKQAKEEGQEKEYVLDEKLPPLTLAQKFGLVHAPKPLLSEQEWNHVKAKSNQRDDSGEPCVICKEDFGLQEQVLLSCTHVFHRACLQAFERFTGKKTCPMCRHEQYQTRVIHEGARMHKHKSATRIQSQWRGYVVRCWYKQLRATVPPKDPMLRKKFYEEKLSSIVDRMIKSLDMNMAQFLQEIDSSVQQSRAVFSQWDATHHVIDTPEWEQIQLKAVQRGETNCPICLTELYLTQSQPNEYTENPSKDLNSKPHSVGHHATRRKHEDRKLLEKLNHDVIGSPQTQTGAAGSTDTINKTSSVSQVKSKNEKMKKVFSTEVPELNESKSSESGCPQKKKIRSTALLSCTHVFHATCLQTLEDIAMLEMRNTCPVCRAHYQKKIIVY